MIKSMTAYARVEMNEGTRTVSAEIRSYNSRNLDMVLKIPHTYLPLEEQMKNLVQKKIARGRIEVRLSIRDEAPDACAFEVDATKAAAYHQALSQLKASLGLSGDIDINQMAQVPGLIKPAEVQADLDQAWGLISTCLEKGLDELEIMRQKEGDFLKADFEQRLSGIAASIDEIENLSDGLLPHYQERLKERIAALTQGLVEIDPARIAQEAAFLADKSDISEEIVRSRSHVEQFRAFMAADEPAGRKLNFLIQEFNREFNTMGSKTGKTTVSHLVVQLKSELEKIREQVQNVE